MEKKKKLLLINGSSRIGNCHIILDRVAKSVGDNVDCELIDLRKKNIGECYGCHYHCSYERGCVQKDDMAEILAKMLEADLIIIASPNYFQNVSGITKKFFDRTTPFYKNRMLRNKRLIFVFVGGLDCAVTENTVTYCANGWARPMKLKWLNNYIFQATEITQFANPEDYESKMNNLITEVKEEMEILS